MNPANTKAGHTHKYSVYWQPGCSSCLRAKEFLTAHGIEYNSINVREDDSAMTTLAGLGARSIPVVTQGREFVFAQDIDVLANFVGIELNRSMLSMAVLVARLDMLLAAAQRYLLQLPDNVLTRKLPGRDRNYLDLAFHVFMIPAAFLEAVQGGELTFEHFERIPAENRANPAEVNAFGTSVRNNLAEWWRQAETGGHPADVSTYYGQHSTHSVLERTAWHTAQHARQLMQVLINSDITPNGPLGEKELAGLPLPDGVYDDEVKFDHV
jgi:glutaredoxin